MPNEKTPAQTERLTIQIMSGVAAFLFLMFAGFGGWGAWSSYSHSQKWTPAAVTVDSVENLCNLQTKKNKNWRDEETGIACDEAERLVGERNSLLSPWRLVKAEFANVSYEAGGSVRRVKARSHQVADVPLAVGSQYPVVVDPAEPLRFDKPFGPAQMKTFWMLLGIGAAIAAATFALGWAIAKANRKLAEKKLAAAQTAPAGVTGAASAAAGLPSALPMWSRAVRWLGLIVAVAGSLLGLVALAGSFSGGDTEGMRGGIIIIAISIAVWRLLVFISNIGKNAA